MPSLTPGNKFFYPALEDAPWEKDSVLALKAFYPYVGSKPHHLPFIAAAGVFLLEADYVIQFNLYNHSFHLPEHSRARAVISTNENQNYQSCSSGGDAVLVNLVSQS